MGRTLAAIDKLPKLGITHILELLFNITSRPEVDGAAYKSTMAYLRALSKLGNLRPTAHNSRIVLKTPISRCYATPVPPGRRSRFPETVSLERVSNLFLLHFMHIRD